MALKIRVDPAPAIETAWCAAVAGNQARRSSPPPTATPIRSYSSSAPRATTGSTRSGATPANCSPRRRNNARPPPISDAHRRRRPALCRERRPSLRFRILNRRALRNPQHEPGSLGARDLSLFASSPGLCDRFRLAIELRKEEIHDSVEFGQKRLRGDRALRV